MKIAPRSTTVTTKTTPVSTTTTPATTTTPTTTTTTLPPLPKATTPTMTTANASTLAAKTWTQKAYATPQTQPLPAPSTTNPLALAQKLAPTLAHDVESHRYDTSSFALQLLAHLDGKRDLVKAFRSFAPSAIDAWNDGGSSCVGHCLSLVDRLRRDGIPAALVPVGHANGQQWPHEPPYAHVAVVVPFVDQGVGGVVVCDTGNNVSAPAVLFPGKPVTVPLGDGKRSFTYELALDGKSVAVSRSLSSGTETSTLSLVELTNPDAALTAPYAAMNPLITICARDDRGGVRASVVVDVEQGLVRCSMGPHKTQLSFGDDITRVVDDVFAAALGTDAATLTKKLETIVAGAPTLNALRVALEGGAA